MGMGKGSYGLAAATVAMLAVAASFYLQGPASTKEPAPQASDAAFRINASAADACAAILSKVTERFSERAQLEPCPGPSTTVWHDPEHQKFIVNGYIDFAGPGSTIRRTRYRAEAQYNLSDTGRPLWTTVEVIPTGE